MANTHTGVPGYSGCSPPSRVSVVYKETTQSRCHVLKQRENHKLTVWNKHTPAQGPQRMIAKCELVSAPTAWCRRTHGLLSPHLTDSPHTQLSPQRPMALQAPLATPARFQRSKHTMRLYCHKHRITHSQTVTDTQTVAKLSHIA